VPQFLKTVTFNIACNTGLAWKNINSMTIKNCWLRCVAAIGDSIKHTEGFLSFTEDVREASSTLHYRLQINDMQAWFAKMMKLPPLSTRMKKNL
jgi:hypothetical protein